MKNTVIKFLFSICIPLIFSNVNGQKTVYSAIANGKSYIVTKDNQIKRLSQNSNPLVFGNQRVKVTDSRMPSIYYMYDFKRNKASKVLTHQNKYEAIGTVGLKAANVKLISTEDTIVMGYHCKKYKVEVKYGNSVANTIETKDYYVTTELCMPSKPEWYPIVCSFFPCIDVKGLVIKTHTTVENYFVKKNKKFDNMDVSDGYLTNLGFEKVSDDELALPYKED